MLIVLFCDLKGVIMIEWAPDGQTVYRKYYREVLFKLKEKLERKDWMYWKTIHAFCEDMFGKQGHSYTEAILIH